MVGSIYLLIFLVTFGNLYLNKPVKDEFIENAAILNFINTVCFIDSSNNMELGKTINDWFLFLKNDGVKYLKLHYIAQNEDWKTAGFVGGTGRWLIEAKKDSGSDWYDNKWEVTDVNNKEKKIWTVTFFRMARDYSMNISYSTDLNFVKENLKKCLTDIKKFSEENNFGEYFINIFDKGLACLEMKYPIEKLMIRDLFPENYLNLNAVRLLIACDISWVFGAMGSWNDKAFGNGRIFNSKEEKEYEQFSENLFKEICTSIVCAVNTTIKY
jgi:hypothetical protein